MAFKQSPSTRPLGAALLALAAVSVALLAGGLGHAATGEVLILETTVSGGVGSPEALAVIATARTPVLVNPATWASMSQAQFAAYDAIVLGDPTCISSPTGIIDVAEANATVWGPAIDGNVIVIGSDPVYHYTSEAGARQLIDQGIAFAVDEPGKTGAYLDLSCYYHFASPATPVPVLDGIEGGGFEVIGADSLPGLNDVRIVATHPALAGLTDAALSNWGNSVHEGFEVWPVQLEVLAIARDPDGSHTAPDGTTGYPYILARGVTIVSDITLSPETAVNPIGSTHQLTATVTTDDPVTGTPVIGTIVDFEIVAGPNVGTTFQAVTDGAGQAFFSYIGAYEGVDTIEATFMDAAGARQRSNRVTKEWVESEADGAIISPSVTQVIPGPLQVFHQYVYVGAEDPPQLTQFVPGFLPMLIGLDAADLVGDETLLFSVRPGGFVLQPTGFPILLHESNVYSLDLGTGGIEPELDWSLEGIGVHTLDGVTKLDQARYAFSVDLRQMVVDGAGSLVYLFPANVYVYDRTSGAISLLFNLGALRVRNTNAIHVYSESRVGFSVDRNTFIMPRSGFNRLWPQNAYTLSAGGSTLELSYDGLAVGLSGIDALVLRDNAPE